MEAMCHGGPFVFGGWAGRHIKYGPTDIVLLDGNIPHGITNLRDLPGQGTTTRPELRRFAVILFSDFKREKGMRKHGNYDGGMWKKGHEVGLISG